MRWNKSFEGTFHSEDADLQKMAKVLSDVNIKECPYFDLSDKYGNSARYYRENQWIPCSEVPPKSSGAYLVTVKWPSDEYSIDVYEYNVSHKEWNDGESFCGEQAVAWMKLPDLYKGGQ